MGPAWLNWVIAISIACVVYILGLLLSLSKALELTAITAGCMISFVFPGAMYWKSLKTAEQETLLLPSNSHDVVPSTIAANEDLMQSLTEIESRTFSLPARKRIGLHKFLG